MYEEACSRAIPANRVSGRCDDRYVSIANGLKAGDNHICEAATNLRRHIQVASQQFFRDVQASRFVLVISDGTTRELQEAPEQVRQVLVQLPEENVEEIAVDDEVTSLRNAYLPLVWLAQHRKQTPNPSRQQPLRKLISW